MQEQAKQLLQAYFNYLQAEKRVASLTFKEYRRDLLRLQDYCIQQRIDDWQALQSKDVRLYISTRHKDGIGGRSLQRELAAVRGFYLYLHKKHAIQHDPLSGIRPPKSAKKLPNTLDVDQIAGVLDAPADSALEIRDLAMFELFYSSGLRLNELVLLDCRDMDFSEGHVRIHFGKGGKERIVPVGKKAETAIKNWLAIRPDVNTPALFISAREQRLSTRSVQLRLERWRKKHCIPESMHPHMFRHSFASHLLESCQDIRAVQELLGHSNISTTQIYTQLDFNYLSGIYDKAHPRARKK